MRVSMHGGRGHAGYAKHNDHVPTKNKDGHIDQNKTDQNVTWTCLDEGTKRYTCDGAEREFYRRFFGATVDAQNAKYRKKGNYQKVKTVEEWMSAAINQPRAVILQIGDAKSSVGGAELETCIREFIEWKQDRFKDNLKIISWALHRDEPRHAEHGQIQEVWYWHDENGLPRTGIKKALAEAGVELPDPEKPEGADNYRMATVDAECRQKWQEIVMSHGYEIETEPDRTRTTGHMGRKAWSSYCDAMEQVEQDRQELAVQKAAEAAREANVSRLIRAGREALAREASREVGEEAPSHRQGLDISDIHL